MSGLAALYRTYRMAGGAVVERGANRPPEYECAIWNKSGTRRAHTRLAVDVDSLQEGKLLTLEMTELKPVSAGNPCPFLRALVAHGLVNDQYEPLGRLAKTICRIAAASEGGKPVPYAVVVLIALMANGLSPMQAYRNSRNGLHASGLRGGPLDKRGVSSRIIRPDGLVDEAELDRLASFASNKTGTDQTVEQGLDLAEITRFMDANWERARGSRRRIDRKLMDGEWPVLLEVLGKQGVAGRYLAIADVRRLVLELALPDRIMARVKGA